MSAEKPGHYVVVKGRGYWSPTKKMKDAGFKLLSCGPDGLEARQKATDAEANYQRWRATGGETPNPFPAGSLGSFWHRLHSTELWKRKARATREEYEYVWEKYISPEFGKRRIDQIAPMECEKFHITIESNHGEGERFKAMKILRALFSAAIKYRVLTQSPATTLPNPMPRGRQSLWLEAEVQTLISDSWENQFFGMSVAISIAWDTMLSPVDVRTLRPSEIRKDPEGVFVHIARKKTNRPVLAPVSSYTRDLILGYLDTLNVEIGPQDPLVRARTGDPYKTKDSFAKDFRRVRGFSFKGDDRKFLDLRRSGNVEAYVGGADRDTMGKALGNRLGDNQFLFETYTPPTLAASRQIFEARQAGREKLQKKENDLNGLNRS